MIPGVSDLMIIGRTFAYGHIPKTGGDAVHAWFAQIPGITVDSVDDPAKHDFFWQRKICKSVYALSIRRLPSWALSYLHELSIHPNAARDYGMSPSDTIRPENAFKLQPDRYLLQHQMGGQRVSEWLRMEYLFDDVMAFIQRHVQPVTPELCNRLARVTTKGSRSYDHDIGSFFTQSQIVALYARNPLWAKVERAIYGDLLYSADVPRGSTNQILRMSA